MIASSEIGQNYFLFINFFWNFCWKDENQI